MTAGKPAETLRKQNRKNVTRPPQTGESRSAAGLSLFVRAPNAQKTISLYIDSNLTATGLKQQICKKIGLPATKNTVLSLGGKALDFGRSVKCVVR